MTYHEYSPIVRILFVPKPSAKVPLLLQMLLAKCADTFYYGETSGKLSYTISYLINTVIFQVIYSNFSGYR